MTQPLAPLSLTADVEADVKVLSWLLAELSFRHHQLVRSIISEKLKDPEVQQKLLMAMLQQQQRQSQNRPQWG